MGEPAVELVNVTNEEIIALNRDFTLFPWSAQKALNPIPIDRAEAGTCGMLKESVVEATLEMGYAIMEEAGLSFLGFGIQPPTPSWGNLLSNAQEHLTRHPWLAIFPGLMIFLTIISISYIGDGLWDAFDPFKVLKQVGEV